VKTRIQTIISFHRLNIYTILQSALCESNEALPIERQRSSPDAYLPLAIPQVSFVDGLKEGVEIGTGIEREGAIESHAQRPQFGRRQRSYRDDQIAFGLLHDHDAVMPCIILERVVSGYGPTPQSLELSGYKLISVAEPEGHSGADRLVFGSREGASDKAPRAVCVLRDVASSAYSSANETNIR
jgi:hypothetical protein